MIFYRILNVRKYIDKDETSCIRPKTKIGISILSSKCYLFSSKCCKNVIHKDSSKNSCIAANNVRQHKSAYPQVFYYLGCLRALMREGQLLACIPLGKSAKNLFSPVISFNEVICNTDHIQIINFFLVHVKHQEMIQTVVDCA